MINKYRKNMPSWSMIVLTLAAITLGFLTLSNNQLAVASRLDQESSESTTDAESAPESIPTTLAYQGILRDVNGSLITGQRDMTLRIYDNVTGGTVLHTETINDVQVRDGVFSVVLGDVTPIGSNVFANAPRFLGITVAPDPEMVPRQRLHPVPWAQQATTALQANHASSADQATTANQANVAGTLINNATVTGLTVNTSLKIPSYGYLRIEGSPDRQTYPYFSMGGQGSFLIDAPNVVGGRFTVTTDGNVGIGTRSPAYKLDVVGKVRAQQGFNGNCVQNSWNPGVVGSNINISCNQDVAETFATTELTEPGDVVVLQPQAATEPTVHLSRQPYAGQLVGVVSTNPGLVFDRGETYLAGNNADLITEDRTVVAMIGRVPVKFSLENGDIAVGDPLASSSAPGAAMKATQAGQIIGYALQSSDEASDGKILAWLQLGYYIPTETLAQLNGVSMTDAGLSATTEANGLDEELTTLKAQNTALLERIEALEAKQ